MQASTETIRQMLPKILLLFFLLKLSACQLQNPSAEQFLMGATLTNYNKNIRPSPIVVVFLRLYLREITLDEEQRLMTSSLQVMQHWYEPRFRWNSSLYDNTTHLMMPAKNVWLPDTFIYNTADSNGYLPLSDNSQVLISNIGTVYFAVPMLNVNTRCDMDLFYYPFDKQTCSVVFTSWMQSSTRINYAISSSTVFMNMFEENPDWEVSSYAVTTGLLDPKFPPDAYKFMMLKVEFVLRRRLRLGIMLHLVVPCQILNLVMLFSYLMPFVAQITISKNLKYFYFI